ncbi:MAG: phage tail tape measure protein, partial [Butyrivibrio sp.]|nr:phage tail tape measure protein [Butyrivibrio sp.]
DALQKQAENVEELKNKLSLAQQDYDKAAQKAAYYQTSVNYTSVELKGMQTELSQTEKYLKEAEQSTDGCATSINEYGEATEDAADKTSVLGDVLKANLLSDAIKAGIKALAESIKEIADSAIDTGSSYEAAMSKVAGTMGMTVEEINNGSEAYTMLADAAKESGKSTIFSATESAEALNYLALAGFDAEKQVATLPKVLDVAAAGGLDLAYAADLVTDSMSALNLETDQLDTHIDEMARTAQKSNTSIAQLGEATLECAGTVSLTGQSIETMNAELGILANNGIKGAEGGTHLRNILLALSAPTDKAAASIKELGIQTSDSQGNMRDLNDIMVDLNAAMEGMSSEEKTQLINKIFNKTDIAAVNALLKGTGNEFDYLYHEIQNSSGAAKEMADTLNNNLKGKVTILESALEGLGISTYEIFDDEMKNSVQSATDAVGRLQNAMDSGDLGVSMRKFSKSLGEAVEWAVDFGEDALPKVIDGLAWLIDNLDFIASCLAGVAAAWGTYKIVTEGLVVVQNLINAAMSANPAVALALAVIGLTTAVEAYWSVNKDNLAITDETTESTNRLTEATKKLNESYAGATEERTASRKSMETEAAVCKNLVQELIGLQSKTALTTQEEMRQKAIIDQLNQAVPELNLAIDEQTGLLNMSTDELYKNVDAMMALGRAEAAREDLERIIKDQYEAEKMLLELKEQEEEQTKRVEEAQEAYNKKIEEATAGYERYGQSRFAESQALEEAQAAQEELAKQIEATQAAYNGFTKEYEDTQAYIDNIEAAYGASEAIEELGDAATDSDNDISALSDTVEQAMTEMQESVSESISQQMDLFSEWDGAIEISGEKMVANMQSQVTGLQEWADNIETLADRGINQGLLQVLADMGPTGAAYVASFVDMTDEELEKANELYVESLSLPDETAEQIAESYKKAGEKAAEKAAEGATDSETNLESAMELSDEAAERVAESYKGVGEKAVEGMITGIDETGTNIEDAGTNMGDALLDATNNALEINSPSKKYKKIGEFVVAGIVQGIAEERAAAIGLVEDLSNSMVTAAQRILSAQTFTAIGRQITDGLIAGIESGRSGVANAIAKMCTDAIEAAKAELDIHSPSKKFAYLGEMSGEGYTEGLQRSMSNASEVISAFMADAQMVQQASVVRVDLPEIDTGTSNREYNINQSITINSPADDIITMGKKFKQWQREAANEW